MLLPLLLMTAFAQAESRPFRIDVVDDATGRGVPLVELTTVNRLRFVTDSNGIVAVDQPDLMGTEVYFHVASHGYEHEADGFGYRGRRLEVEAGGRAEVRVKRLNIAERLYRVTGAGIEAETVRVGAEPSLREPLLNAQVFGSDSVQNAVLGGEYLWFWGDTSRPSYPLGLFHTPGARSTLPGSPGFDPGRGIDLNYWTGEDGFARATAEMAGEGPTWIGGLTVLTGDDGRERLFCGYVKVRPPMSVYKHGLAEWDAGAARFEPFADFPEGGAVYPEGHPIYREVDGARHVAYPTPFPLTRVRATPEALADLGAYEAFSCLEPGTKPEEGKVIRDAEGRPAYAWRAGAAPLTQEQQRKLVESGKLKPEELLIGLRDVESGKEVLAHGGSVNWNEHRRRWVLIVVEAYGSPSFLGEVWYAEGDTPLGPWAYARKVVSHDDYSFYNPKQHPLFDEDGGRRIYFEGTYTAMFSGNKNPTPRYDYNQVMYRLDLDDSRLNLPVAVYRKSVPEGESLATFPELEPVPPGAEIAFFARERPSEGAIELAIRGAARTWFGLAAGAGEPPAGMAALYEWADPSGDRFAYRVGDQAGPAGWKRGEAPLGLVWANPCLSPFPLER